MTAIISIFYFYFLLSQGSLSFTRCSCCPAWWWEPWSRTRCSTWPRAGSGRRVHNISGGSHFVLNFSAVLRIRNRFIRFGYEYCLKSWVNPLKDLISDPDSDLVLDPNPVIFFTLSEFSNNLYHKCWIVKKCMFEKITYLSDAGEYCTVFLYMLRDTKVDLLSAHSARCQFKYIGR